MARVGSAAWLAGRRWGTLGEKPLHAALKRWYAQPGDLVEEPLGGFVIDLVRDGLLIEIQTRGFASMKRKLATLLADGHVFTTADVADAMGRPRRLAQQATYCLRRAGVIEQLGKQGNAIIYGRCDQVAQPHS